MAQEKRVKLIECLLTPDSPAGRQMLAIDFIGGLLIR